MKHTYLKTTITAFVIASLFAINGCDSTSIKNTNVPTDNLDLTNTFVYDSNSPYKDTLKSCVAVTKSSNSCSLESLPLLRDSGSVTKEAIKSRLVVSHKWMGDNFLKALDYLDSDIKDMLGAVTAIVIDDDVKPAFYTTQTGAIYIDARYLWLNANQANDITQKDDFRSSYGTDLNFVPAWRYVKSGNNALPRWDITKPVNRTISDIKLNLARLLYHELSHANDFANRDITDSADKTKSIVEILESNNDLRISSKLYQEYPLTHPELKHLGRVFYFGTTPNDRDKSLTASDVGALFASDDASNMYNYANQFEDFAMLFETAMMKYHYNIDMDIAFVSNPNSASSCNDYKVGWGVRNRIAESSVTKRVEFVLKRVLPNKNWDNFLQNGIGSSKMLTTNSGWCASITANNIDANFRLNNSNSNKEIPLQDFKAPDFK